MCKIWGKYNMQPLKLSNCNWLTLTASTGPGVISLSDWLVWRIFNGLSPVQTWIRLFESVFRYHFSELDTCWKIEIHLNVSFFPICFHRSQQITWCRSRDISVYMVHDKKQFNSPLCSFRKRKIEPWKNTLNCVSCFLCSIKNFFSPLAKNSIRHLDYENLWIVKFASAEG